MSIQAREYQDWATQSIFEYFKDKTGNPLVAMPTGTGKSIVIAMFVKKVLFQWPRQRVMVLTHVKELIDQNYEKLKLVWPQAPAGIYSAGLNRRDRLNNIIFAGIASVSKRAAEFGFIDLVMIDEAHLVSPNDKTMYWKFISSLKETNPHLKVIGLTATPFRLGQGKLVEEGGLFTDVCCDMTDMQAFNWLIDQGYLCPLVPKRTQQLLDVGGVHMQGGEFIASELQHAVDKTHITEAAVREILDLTKQMNSGLIFCAGVDHAIHVADMMNAMGDSCVAVHSKMDSKDRDKAIKDWKAGRIRCISNNNVMTTGVDHPGLDFIAVLRPTASPGLWIQMLGRGTRPMYADGFDVTTKSGRLAAIAAGPKKYCLVLDFAGNTKRLGPINDPVIRPKGGKGGDAPVKCCESCQTYNHASVRICWFCQAPFPEPQLKIKETSATEELIKSDIPISEMFQVQHVTYSLHEARSKETMLRVSYFCGLRHFSEYVGIGHSNQWVARKARTWWKARCESIEPPLNAKASLEHLGMLKAPTHIQVWTNKQHPEIMSYCYDGSAFGTQAVESVAEPGINVFTGKDSPSAIGVNPNNTLDDDIPF